MKTIDRLINELNDSKEFKVATGVDNVTVKSLKSIMMRMADSPEFQDKILFRLKSFSLTKRSRAKFSNELYKIILEVNEAGPAPSDLNGVNYAGDRK